MRVGDGGWLANFGGAATDIYFDGGNNWLSSNAGMWHNGFYKLVGDPASNNAVLYQGGSPVATLVADGSVNDLGNGVSVINTGHFVVGAESAGKLFNYRQRGPLWTYQSATLPAALPKSEFGSDVAIDGNIAVVGAQDFDNRGAAFVFTRDTASSETWSYQATIQSADIGTGDKFGSSVAFSEGRAVVGAPNANSGKGVSYVFERTGDTWNQWARLAPGDLSSGAQFGTAADIYKDTLIVGAPGMNAAYVYTRANAVWAQQARLDGSGEFGRSVAVDADTALVGAPATSTTRRGDGLHPQQQHLGPASNAYGERRR